MIGKSKICRLYRKVSRDFGQSELLERGRRVGTLSGTITRVQRSVPLFVRPI